MMFAACFGSIGGARGRQKLIDVSFVGEATGDALLKKQIRFGCYRLSVAVN